MRYAVAALLLLSFAGFSTPSRAQEGIPVVGFPWGPFPPAPGLEAGAYPLLGMNQPLDAAASSVFLWGVPLPQQEREFLPVFDDAGRRIYRAQIESRIDRGLGGLLGGSLLGSALGSALFHLVFAKSMECGEDWKGDLCSPQEKSLRHRVPTWGAVVGAVSIGYLGFRMDRTTWDEALEAIRSERRFEGGSLDPRAPEIGGGGS
ncbi:MAG: hypothetical protein MUO50_14465 [Longimicrobiales bacterium]|nr:hypothetical protein [Longimicrobiales bacterium]